MTEFVFAILKAGGEFSQQWQLEFVILALDRRSVLEQECVSRMECETLSITHQAVTCADAADEY